MFLKRQGSRFIIVYRNKIKSSSSFLFIAALLFTSICTWMISGTQPRQRFVLSASGKQKTTDTKNEFPSIKYESPNERMDSAPASKIKFVKTKDYFESLQEARNWAEKMTATINDKLGEDEVFEDSRLEPSSEDPIIPQRVQKPDLQEIPSKREIFKISQEREKEFHRKDPAFENLPKGGMLFDNMIPQGINSLISIARKLYGADDEESDDGRQSLGERAKPTEQIIQQLKRKKSTSVSGISSEWIQEQLKKPGRLDHIVSIDGLYKLIEMNNKDQEEPYCDSSEVIEMGRNQKIMEETPSEGNQMICDESIADDCIAYTFGSTHPGPFEDYLLEKGCQVWLFNPLIKEKTAPKRDKYQLNHSAVRLGPVDFANQTYQVSTLQSIMKSLKHSSIKYLKFSMDEWNEWTILDQILQESPSVLDSVNQINLLLHLHPVLVDLSLYKQYLGILKKLLKQKFTVFATQGMGPDSYRYKEPHYLNRRVSLIYYITLFKTKTDE